MDEILKNLLQGKTAGDTLGGARMALFLQMAQFAAHCKPEVFRAGHEDGELANKLLEIHRAGGVLISVAAVGVSSFVVTAYMPQEKKDGESTVQH